MRRIPAPEMLRDFGAMIFLNLLFAVSYLFSPSNQLLGFPQRQDAYWYMLVANHMQKLVSEGIIPIGTTWFRYAYCGFPEVVYIDPLYAVYNSMLTLTKDFVLSWKISTLFFYVLSSFAMYYLVWILVRDRQAAITSAVTYTFTQLLTFEIFLGHLSMVAGVAYAPLIIAFYVKAARDGSPKADVLSSVFLGVLLITRPDLGYFMISFMIVLMVFFVYLYPKKRRIMFYTSILFFVAFLISFPFLGARYVSNLSELTGSFGRYTYDFYSPDPFLLFLPVISSVGVYLGISVLVFSALGACAAAVSLLSHRSGDSINEKLVLFLVFPAVAFITVGVGSATPLYGFLFRYAPYFAAFRVPTRWLIVGQLCLAVLAGRGSSFLTSSLSRRRIHHAFWTVLILSLIFLDLSVFLAPAIYEGSGWRATAHYDTDYSLFEFPQPCYTPPENSAYEYVGLDDTSSYRVLVAPLVYSESYYQYLRYLRDTDATFAHNYVQYPLKSKLQANVYNGFRYGNFTSKVGEQMALLGVKYLVYNFYWGEWKNLVMKMNRTDDLEFILEDKGYILYRNRRFGDVHVDENMLRNYGFENPYLDWSSLELGHAFSELDLDVFRSGDKSMKLTVSESNSAVEATQIASVGNSTMETEFKLSGWSKAENVSGDGSSYALTATVVYADGTSSSEALAHFSKGTHDWEYSSVTFSSSSTKPMKYITVSFFLKNATGTAWFDDIYLAKKNLSDGWMGAFPVKTLYGDIDAVLSEGNKAHTIAAVRRENAMTLQIRINAAETSYVILSESYDEGWRIASSRTSGTVSLQQYENLIAFFVAEPGVYDVTVTFAAYYESVKAISLSEGLALIVIGLFMYFSGFSHRKKLKYLFSKIFRKEGTAPDKYVTAVTHSWRRRLLLDRS